MSAKTTESKASRQDHPSEPALDIDNNLYDDSESQKKDCSNAGRYNRHETTNAASFAEIIWIILRKFAENNHKGG